MLYVIGDREMNGRDDSDFYAVCIDGDTGATVTRTYGTTRFGGGYSTAAAWAEANPAVATMATPPADVIERYRRSELRLALGRMILVARNATAKPGPAIGTRPYNPRKATTNALRIAPGARYEVMRVVPGNFGPRALVRDARNEGWAPADALRPTVSGAAMRAEARRIAARAVERWDAAAAA